MAQQRLESCKLLAPEAIDAVCARFAELTHWQDHDFVRSYRAFREDLLRARYLLREAGCKSGSAVGVYGLSTYDTWLIILAGQTLGLLVAPLPSRLSFSQLQVALQQVPLQLLLGSRDDRASSLAITKWSLAEGAIEEVPLLWEPECAGVMLLSSGSSGTPKGVVHSPASLTRSALATLDFYGAAVGESWLLSLDLAHIGGLQIAWRCFVGGLRCLGGYGPQEVNVSIEALRPDYLSLVPTQLQRLLAQRSSCETLRSCKAILLGGAASGPELLAQAHAERLPISVTYGSSETASQIAATQPGEPSYAVGDVGSPLPIWELKVSEGRLLVRGAALFLGYWQKGQFLPRCYYEDQGYYLSPDRAEWIAGRLCIRGREDTIFQVGGENVAPGEIVQALQSLAYGGDWVVIPWPDREYGAVPLLIARGLEAPPDWRQVQASLQVALPRLKHPRRYYWHRTTDTLKPSRAYYIALLSAAAPELELLWTI